MNLTANEKVLLNEALKYLREGVPVGKVDIRKEPIAEDGIEADALLRFENILLDYRVLVKYQVGYKELGALQLMLEHLEGPVMLVTNFITIQMAAELRRRGIQFLDTAGNMYLNQENPFLLVFTAGNRDTRILVKPRLVKVFKGTKLKVLFALLADKKAINQTYREIAEKAGVALGTVGWVFTDLKQLGYVRTNKAGRRIENREKLLNIWFEAYPTEIRPKLNPIRFTVKDKNWWKEKDLTEFDAVLGGEGAAEILTRYIHPEVVSVFLSGGFEKFARELKFKKDDNGNLVVLEKFWNGIDFTYENAALAPLLIICAELLAEGSTRNIETVKMIREKYDL